MSDRNQLLFERAAQVIPGGVNSPVRAFRAVGGTPRFVQRALGAYFWDANGQRYIDYIGSWGPMILGHGHPAVLEAAVVARPDVKWGETPCAFVTLREGKTASEADIIAFCRGNMAHFKAPKNIVFGPLPKTSTEIGRAHV